MEKTVISMMIVIVMTKVLGFTRDIILAYFYGASNISDAYLISMTIPSVFFAIVALGIHTSFIPVYTRLRENEGERAAALFTSNLTNIVLLFTVLMTVILMLFPTVAVQLFASGFDEETRQLAITFTRISAIGMMFTALIFISQGLLEVHGRYTLSSLSGLPLNILTILFIYLSVEYHLYLLAVGTLVALAGQFLFFGPALWKIGYRHKWKISLKEKSIRNIFYMAMPVVIGVSVNQLNVLVDRTLASRIIEGGISAIAYTDRVVYFIQGIFITALVTVMFPKITKLAARKNMQQLKEIVGKVISAAMLLVIPSTIGMMLFSKEIIALLFGRGAFGEAEVAMTGGVLFFYSLGLLGYGLREVLTKVFYSLEDTKTPMINATCTVVLNIGLNLVLSKTMGINGLALATSISALTSIVLLYAALVRKIGTLHTKDTVADLWKALLASGIMGIAAKGMYEAAGEITPGIIALGIGILTGVLVYGGVLWLLRQNDVIRYQMRIWTIAKK
ncbi:murein biosynthesis integral membrane protein MurJ [Planococcus lenghuensis]|uniref:Probable lipid II flippase MurJ n=1 Tax=Planococcus lenghuensis TaxID=2213202 RepID=A0A1Q2L198_9BACL|nr:murein biosynthesis integral membrane protein MurJ [Planococcus lenghuensis]AQQ54230.1 murein biosynthesis integral membrane protein MurJ [Planococcus lenghuensis]